MTARDLHTILSRFRFAPPVEMTDLEQLRDTLRPMAPGLPIDITLDQNQVRVQVGRVYSYMPIG